MAGWLEAFDERSMGMVYYSCGSRHGCGKHSVRACVYHKLRLQLFRRTLAAAHCIWPT